MMSIGCNSDSDCKGPYQMCDPYNRCRTNCEYRGDCPWKEACDDDNKICIPECNENEDCKGMGELCDKSKGLCVPGNIYLNYMKYADFFFLLQVVNLMMIVDGKMKNVTKRIIFANLGAMNIKIAIAYHVILIRECVMEVRFDFLII